MIKYTYLDNRGLKRARSCRSLNSALRIAASDHENGRRPVELLVNEHNRVFTWSQQRILVACKQQKLL